jgi:PAS domain S-box-containing protein
MTHLATVNLMLLLTMSVVTAAAGVFLWLRSRAPGARALALLLLVCALNSGAFGLEFTTGSLSAKIALEKLLVASAAAIPALWLVFALQYTARGRYVTRNVVALLSVVPLLSFVLAVSNGAHLLYWRAISLAPGDVYLAAKLVFAPAYWLQVVYANALLAAGTVLLLQLFWRAWNLYRGQAVALLAALSIPWIAESLYLAGLSPVHGIDLVSVAFCIAALLLAVGVTRLRVADVLSVSRAAILDSLVDAVVVLDPAANVLYRNPAGAAFLEHLGPEPIPQALTRVWPQAFDARMGEAGRMAEISTSASPNEGASIFDLSLSPIGGGGGGQPLAKVLVVRDVTQQRQVEQALRESEENFRTLFDTVDDVIVVATPDGRIVHANRVVSERLGYSPAELAGMHVLDLRPPERRDEAEAIIAAMLKGERDSCPLPLQAKSGALVAVESRVWLGRWNDAECVFSVSKDLTKEQEALQKFEGLFRSNPAVMALSSLPEGRFIEVNDAFASVLGYSHEETIGRTGEELGLFVDPQQQRVVAEQLLAQGRLADCELKVRSKDGAVLDGLFSGELVESQGQVAALIVMIDQTERRRAEKQLAAAATQWRETFDAMSDSVALFDGEGRVLRCNAATTELTGRGFDDIVGRPCYEIFHGSDACLTGCPQQSALRSGQTETITVELDGRWLRITFQPLTDEQSGVGGGVHVVSDVSDLKRAEQGLLESLTTQQTVTDGVIAALARTVEVRDPYTAGHQRRVSELGAAIALAMGFGEERVEGVRVAGMLHDVGKITIPAEILSKPGRLTAMEFQLIKGHAQSGFDILESIHFPWLVAQMTVQHHERQDGSGYPAGLSGDEILLEARILAVADVVEAMASHRPYRAALGLEAALDEVRSGAGTRYEAAVVEACERVFAEGFAFSES